MYVKNMVIDGFKSYGQRTEINDFDDQVSFSSLESCQKSTNWGKKSGLKMLLGGSIWSAILTTAQSGTFLVWSHVKRAQIGGKKVV